MTITEFLLARIAEDEQRAASAGHGCGYLLHEHNAGWVEVDLPAEHNVRPSYELRFIREHSPDRVLAECEAKRRIVADRPLPIGHFWDGQRAQHDNALRFLASVYADHPDYRDEWRV
jgi:hypothetical protein